MVEVEARYQDIPMGCKVKWGNSMNDDETEALSYKYHGCNILRLSSGAFALFLPWTNAEGMPLVFIGTMAEIEPLIMSTADSKRTCKS